MGKQFTLTRPREFTAKACARCGKNFVPQTSSQKLCEAKLCRKMAKTYSIDKILGQYFEVPKASYIKYRKFFRSQKYKVEDERTITYDTSPVGRGFVGLAKSPLQPVKDGFGFKGVLMQTPNREFVQCHICGKWMKKIGGSHLTKHETTLPEYKKQFGFFMSNGLVADASSYRYEKSARKRGSLLDRSEHLNQIRRKVSVDSRKRSEIIEHQNQYGICEAQLEFRLMEYVKRYKSLPSRSSKGDGSKLAKAIYRHFGSLNEGFKHYGLPIFYRKGTSVELVSPNKKQYFLNYNRKDYSKESLYQWMLQECPVLTNQI